MYLQCAIYLISDIVVKITIGDAKASFVIGFITIRAIFLAFFLRVRLRIARLEDKQLSEFLAEKVIKDGFFMGFAQLGFLTFSSIQCEAEEDHWSDCNRTLYSQTGLGFMVVIYTAITLISGLAPKRILEKHVIPTKDILSMNLTVQQIVQTFGLLTAASSAMFLLGSYGADGNLKDSTEKNVILTVTGIGCTCLIVTAGWKLLVIRREINEGEEKNDMEKKEATATAPSKLFLTEASSFWFWSAWLVTSSQTVICILCAITLDRFYSSLATFVFPFTAMVFLVAVFCQPKKHSPKDMTRLRMLGTTFAYLSEIALVISALRKNLWGWAALHLVLIAIGTFGFHCGFKLRSNIGRLPDCDLDEFLVNTLFMGGLRTLLSILFLSFRTSKCIFESGGLEKCDDNAWCSTLISVFLLNWWIMNIVQDSVRREWRVDVSVSVEKVATMRGFGLRRGLQGVLTVFVIICGIFLFAMMSVEKNDNAETVATKHQSVVHIVGAVGLGASMTSAIFEANSSWYAQKKKFQSESSTGTLMISDSGNFLVNECSWFYTFLSFLFTTTTTVLRVLYTFVGIEYFNTVGNSILPISATSFLLALFTKPKRDDKLYMGILYFHFFTFLIFGELILSAGNLAAGYETEGIFTLLRIPVWCYVFKKGLKLRESAGRLPPEELSEFLCQTVLVKGTATIGPMIFFSFETVSCFIAQSSYVDGLYGCSDTARASLYLSVYLLVLTTLSIFSKSTPKSVQRATAWEYSAVATLNLKWWQKLQGGLMAVTALCSLYLLSALGVERDLRSNVGNVGALGFIILMLAVIIGMFSLSDTLEVRQHSGTLSGGLEDRRGGRAISAGEMQDGMILGSLL
ncbi:hypothetical protein TL16_g03669 [Triparma laevis f. inornata]|uniref:Uncharacterized protein n=1 Tax=Triparma laevis f. inornata TaxID=1714386 RepID=A0A9W7E0B5_9STRA|nr:hypothetical protein TL16_g03669 [Triparma laevis f. inornata]